MRGPQAIQVMISIQKVRNLVHMEYIETLKATKGKEIWVVKDSGMMMMGEKEQCMTAGQEREIRDTEIVLQRTGDANDCPMTMKMRDLVAEKWNQIEAAKVERREIPNVEMSAIKMTIRGGDEMPETRLPRKNTEREVIKIVAAMEVHLLA